MLDIETIIGTHRGSETLSPFPAEWGTALAGDSEPVYEQILNPSLHRQLTKSPSLPKEVAQYEQTLPTPPP